MDKDLEKQFASLRSDLKAISLLALIPGFLYFFNTLTFVRKSQRIVGDMLPQGSPPVPAEWAYSLTDILANGLLIMGPLALFGVAACIWFTIRTTTGHFLFLNLGLFLFLVTLGMAMRSACMQTIAAIVSGMNSVPLDL